MRRHCIKACCGLMAALAVFMGISAAAQVITFSNAPAPRAIPRRASIILILAHGLGCNDLSCYGQTNFQTPNLDKLAADGIRFTNFTGAATAAEAEGAFMTGGKEGLTARNGAFRAQSRTVAQVLKDAGYFTGLFGQWDLGDENSSGAPWKQGFEDFGGYFGEPDAEDLYADYRFRYAPDSIYDATNHVFHTFIGRETILANEGGSRAKYVPDLFGQATANFILAHQPDRYNHYQPFFLELNYAIPGDHRTAPPSDAPFSDEPWTRAQKNRAAVVFRLDGYIARLRQAVAAVGMTNNLLIFFTSDTVPEKGSGYFGKSPARDGRVPMILAWPGMIAGGQVSGLKWSAADFLPTAARIGFARTPKQARGKSILPAILGRKEAQETFF
ncbi:MAG: sulfatase-like hydrolase/transferase [Verrucomicrobia bacterium]|nr:sulfatase-like hydrolase/transferase [Verrucomicrobiota bacterium]MDE3100271.1 sulfatase-like hydrolase/transferase [Verrucomicrobiota bacterium]